MTPRDKLLPDFAQEALASDELASADDHQVADALAELGGSLPTTPASAVARQRLVAEASARPMRYEPFLPRLSQIMDLSADRVRDALAKTTETEGWFDVADGVRMFRFSGGPELGGGDCALVWMQPGARFPKHRHIGTERALCLEGEFQDSRGRVYGRGDSETLDPGTEHDLTVSTAGECILAVAVSDGGVEFT